MSSPPDETLALKEPFVFVGFTGHRRVLDQLRIGHLVEQALDGVAARTGCGLVGISSIASGSDIAFARATVARKLPWAAFLPLEKSDFSSDFGPGEWTEAEALLATATFARVHPAPDSRRSREEAYWECGVQIVDECDVLIAVWDGEPARGKGGTAEVVNYARKLRRPIVWIHPTTGAITEENTPPAGAKPTGQPAGRPFPAAAPREIIAATFAYHDWIASHHAPRARELATRIIFLHLAATGIALMAPVIGLVAWIGFVMVMIKIVALIYADRLHHRSSHTQETWRRARGVAELCRSVDATWCIGGQDPFDPPLIVPGFRRWQRSLGLLRCLERGSARTAHESARDYTERRLADQVGYFSSQLEKADSRLRRWRRMARAGTWAAILCGIGVIGFIVVEWRVHPEGGPGPLAERILKYLSLVLPLASATIFHWLVAQDCTRRVARNREMLGFLESARERVAQCGSESAVERIVAEVETFILLEVLEWESVSRFSGDLHG